VYRVDWTTNVGRLVALEPEPAEVDAHAAALAAGYNDPANAALMGHTAPIPPEDVSESYEAMRDEGARLFLLFVDDELVGDADLRGLEDGAAEFAFMIAATGQQGKGLGTKFAAMVHAFGFGALGLSTIYASVVPRNTASRRVFEKLGYVLDDSPAARAFADEPGDVVLAIDRATFARENAGILADIRVTER
jgi:RimJ/RimL family protein N-acetyltransferase